MKWPAPVKEGIWPFRDSVYERSRFEPGPYDHLPLDEALRQIRKDREEGRIK